MRTSTHQLIMIIVLAVCLMIQVAFGQEGGFPTEALKTPVVTSHTADVAKPLVLRIDAVASVLRLEFAKGDAPGGTFNPRFSDNIEFRNLPDNDEGEPQPQEFNEFMAGTQIAQWCRAQPDAVTNAAVLRKLCQWMLQQKGIIE